MGRAPTITLVENPDVLAGLVSAPPRPGQLLVGFAAETGDDEGDVLAHGAAKARRKGVHLLAVNAVGEHLGFGDVPNAVVVLDAAGQEVARGQGTAFAATRRRIQPGVRAFLATVRDGSEWLDLGCGSGALAAEWARLGICGGYSGRDFSSALLSEARALTAGRNFTIFI